MSAAAIGRMPRPVTGPLASVKLAPQEVTCHWSARVRDQAVRSAATTGQGPRRATRTCASTIRALPLLATLVCSDFSIFTSNLPEFYLGVRQLIGHFKLESTLTNSSPVPHQTVKFRVFVPASEECVHTLLIDTETCCGLLGSSEISTIYPSSEISTIYKCASRSRVLPSLPTLVCGDFFLPRIYLNSSWESGR
jgi:hypothetical protein